MFHPIPAAVLKRMRHLEEIDRRERAEGLPSLQRLRQIPLQTGRFIALVAATAPAGRIIEIGASAGYSTLWLALACQAMGRTLTTYEPHAGRAGMARETIHLAGVGSVVELVEDDARRHLAGIGSLAFCFLDAENELYGEFFELIVPNLVPGGLLIADNAISHRDQLQPLLDRALNDSRVDAVVVPIGKGELLCRKI
jgi:caffeoyl-CoA O-methyltransferase